MQGQLHEAPDEEGLVVGERICGDVQFERSRSRKQPLKSDPCFHPCEWCAQAQMNAPPEADMAACSRSIEVDLIWASECGAVVIGMMRLQPWPWPES